ncbi:MAG: hypothetical protein ABJN98_10460 [Roseibium sp.]
MQSTSVLRLSRRTLLSGIAVVALTATLDAKAGRVFDRIIMRDGWILKESDIS